MKKINQFYGATIRSLVISVMIAGLSACSFDSTRDSDDDSPWRSKRAAELDSAPSDSDVMMDDGASAEGETGLMVEPMIDVAPEPEPEPEPVVEEPVVAAPLTPEQRLMSMPGSSYAVQIYAGTTKDSVEKFKNMHGLVDLISVPTKRNGAIYHVLVSLQQDRAAADRVAADLQAATGVKPWVRTVSGLQSIVVQ